MQQKNKVFIFTKECDSWTFAISCVVHEIFYTGKVEKKKDDKIVKMTSACYRFPV